MALAITAPIADPAIAMPYDQLTAYIHMWKSLPSLHAQIQACWTAQVHKLRNRPPNRRWTTITGFLPATIATLMQNEWQPYSSSIWVSNKGAVYRLKDWPANQENLEKEWKANIQQKIWQKASRHIHGAGIENGIDIGPNIRLFSQLQNQNKHADAQLLLTINTGGIWGDQRVLAAGYTAPTLCAQCGSSDNSEFHLIWGCPATTSSLDPDIIASNHLCSLAEQQWPATPCLWVRGLRPQNCNIPLPSMHRIIIKKGIFDTKEAIDSNGLVFYVDESGGKFGSYPSLRRCGWGIIAFPVVGCCDDNSTGRHESCSSYRPSNGMQHVGYMYGSLPGPTQTTARATLDAILQLLRVTVGPIIIAPDLKNVVDGMAISKTYLSPSGAHKDLWTQIGAEISDNTPREVTMIKVLAHMTDDEFLKTDVPPQHYLGNKLADLLAGWGAKFHQLPDEIVEPELRSISQHKLILMRLLSVYRIHLRTTAHRNKTERPKKHV